MSTGHRLGVGVLAVLGLLLAALPAGADGADPVAMAQALVEKGEFQAALKVADRAVADAPRSSEAHRVRALAKRRLGDLEGALADANRAIELDPTNARAWNGRAGIKIELKDPKGALTDVYKSLELDPKNAQAYINAAEIFRRQGLLKEALTGISRAIELEPTVSAHYLRRGTIHAQAGDSGRAAKDYSKAVELNPNDKRAAAALAKLRGEAGPEPPGPVAVEPRPVTESDITDADSIPPSKAEEAILKAAGDAPTPEQVKALAQLRAQRAYALLEIAQKQRSPDALELAIEHAVSATQLVGDKAAYWFLLAQVYAESPDAAISMPLAEDAIKKALELDGANHRARLFLGQLLFQQKFYSAALDEFEKVLTARPDLADPRLISPMASAYVLDLSAERGEKFLSALLAKRPEADCARLALAILLNHQGRREPAVAELKKVANSPAASEKNRRYAKELEGLWATQPKEQQP